MTQATIQQLLHYAKAELAAVAENPMFEAEILLAAVLNKPRSFLHAWSEMAIAAAQEQQFESHVARRKQGEPIAYIAGHKEFWSLNLMVTKDTLIPRPESELIVATVLSLFSSQQTNLKIADLGTGSGAIAIALAYERPHWQVVATDQSPQALEIASNNAQQLGLKNLSFLLGNWCTALPSFDFDVIVSNPPYIAEQEWGDYADQLAFEPRNALISGSDGLDAIREISLTAGCYLRANGHLIVEHGFLQGEAVRELFVAAGYSNCVSVRDLAGQERITMGQRLS